MLSYLCSFEQYDLVDCDALRHFWKVDYSRKKGRDKLDRLWVVWGISDTL